MTRWLVKNVGEISGAWTGIDGVRYPAGWLDGADRLDIDRLGAVRLPAPPPPPPPTAEEILAAAIEAELARVPESLLFRLHALERAQAVAAGKIAPTLDASRTALRQAAEQAVYVAPSVPQSGNVDLQPLDAPVQPLDPSR